MMKALRKTAASPGITLTEIPIPNVGPTDLLIRVTKSAICGTDINIYEWKEWAQQNISLPTTIGHEFVGIVEEVGTHVKGFQRGDRVSGEGHLVCEVCRNCRAGKRHLCRTTLGVGIHREGAFADYLLLPASNAFLVPDQISDEIAAIFDPLGNAVHTALSFDLVGEDVLITGAGPIGIMAAAIARHVGARQIVITDVNDQRLQLAEKFDISAAINPLRTNLQDVMAQLKMREGFDVGLEMSGSSAAFSSMIDHMNHGGKVALLGILPKKSEIDWIKVVFNSLFIKGIYGREMYETWYKMVSMLSSGLDISPIITDRFAFSSYQEAFETMKSGRSGKIVLDMQEKLSQKSLFTPKEALSSFPLSRDRA